MKILIISDVHGNLPSLEHVLKKEADADLVVSLGDVVNYGPWSNECVDLLDSLKNKKLIIGNHEEAFIEGVYPGKNIVAKAFFDFCYPKFDRKEVIAGYKNKISLFNSCFVHTINNEYIFPDSEVSIEANTFIGHSHRCFTREINGYLLVNAGSVGQNRQNLDIVNYVIWYPDKSNVKLINDFFPSSFLISEMRSRNYPQTCIDYLLAKQTQQST